MSHNDIISRPPWFAQVAADLQRHEGFREYAYPDPLSPIGRRYSSRDYRWGFRPAIEILREIGEDVTGGIPWTVGYGFTQGVNAFSQMKKNVADRKLDLIILQHMAVLDNILPGWKREHPDYVNTVLANMAFNLGNRLAKFDTTLGLIREHKYAEAGRNLKNTAWYTQVGSRAKELTTRLINGEVAKQHRVGPDFSNVESKVTSTEQFR